MVASLVMAKEDDPKQKKGKTTRHVRVKPDIAEMVSWIVRVDGIKSAALLDPILRLPITTRFNKRKKAIDAIKKAETEARQQAPPEEE